MQVLKSKKLNTGTPAAFTRCPECYGMCNIKNGQIYCRRTDTCGWRENKNMELQYWIELIEGDK